MQDSLIIQLLPTVISLVLGVTMGYFILRFFFRGSILLKLGILWIANVLVNSVNNTIKTLVPGYTQWYAFAVMVVITTFLLYLASKQVLKPLRQSLSNLDKL